MSLQDILEQQKQEELNGVSQTIWDLLDIKKSRKVGISHDRIESIVPVMRDYIAYWREYPDMFVDFLQKGENGEIPETGLKFFFYQRVWKKLHEQAIV